VNTEIKIMRISSTDAIDSLEADNHYVTAGTKEIAVLPVSNIAADDSVLFLWAISSMLPDALYVMHRWGFAYKTAYVWVKDRIGLGYWARSKHEHLLIGTRGHVPAPAPGTQWAPVIEAPGAQAFREAGRGS
jgi:N6-adenosine-specific RNA methylase IME4